MVKYINKSIINDKYYKKYNYLFDYSYNKFNLINQYILYNYLDKKTNNICNIIFINLIEKQQYNNIIQKINKNNIYDRTYSGFNFINFIISNYNKKTLIITEQLSSVINLLNHNYNNINFDVIFLHDHKLINKKYINYIIQNKNYNNNKLYSSYDLNHLNYDKINVINN